jgi:hypothetical protein
VCEGAAKGDGHLLPARPWDAWFKKCGLFLSGPRRDPESHHNFSEILAMNSKCNATLGACCVLAIFTCAATAAGKDEVVPEGMAALPEPLNQVHGNHPDLEKTGYFKVVKAEFGSTEYLDQEALIWTVEVTKRLTCRHAMLLLRHFRDVRFYRNTEYGSQELYWTALYYSRRIADGAIDQDILDPGETFEMWVLMDENKVAMLEYNLADVVLFREQDTRMMQERFESKRKRIEFGAPSGRETPAGSRDRFLQ